MIDAHGREIDYLRVAVTDRCNLRCVYCMPPGGVPPLRHEDLLTFEEIVRVVRVGVSLGITKVRLTGGEPLVRKGVVQLVRSLAEVAGIQRVAMTTNGLLLPQHAAALKGAGLSDLNISLDTLKADRYREITRGGSIEDVFRGIDAALSSGFGFVKVNVVVMRNVNDDEVQDFARLTLRRPIHVRFIELMAMGRTGLADGERLVPAEEILREIERVGATEPMSASGAAGSGPARMFRLAGAVGGIGLISPVTSPFCRTCNRLRLTSEGKLRSCLVRGGEIDLRALLRAPAGGGEGLDREIARAFEGAVALKPLDYSCGTLANMSRIGG